MKHVFIFLFFLFWAGINVGFSQTVTFAWNERPQTKHHFYAIEADDSANVSFVGVGTCTATIKPTSARLIIYKNNSPIDTLYQSLTYTGNTTNIAITGRIKGEIASYKTVIRVGGSSVTADSIKAGVVILCNGQSNMVAGSGQTGVVSSIPLDPYISSFGTSYFANPAAVTSVNSLRFFLGNPNTTYLSGSLGISAFYLAKTLKDSLNLPICVLNGAKSGTLISEHLKKYLPNTRQDSLSIYGRLLLRVKNAKFQPHHIRAFFWYQGESDALTSTLVANYTQSFNILRDSLKKDYGNELPIFMVQIRRECCGRMLDNVLSLQEIQRNLLNTDNIKGVACVNGLAQNTDYCHFRLHAYQKLGTQLAQMYCAYKRQTPTTSLFPQPISAQLLLGGSLIKLLVSAPIDTTQINNCRSFFRLSDGINQFGINSLSAVEDTLFLHFTTPLPNATSSNYRLSYLGSLLQDTAAVFAKSGGTLLSFKDIAVETNGQYNGISATPCNGIPIAGQIFAEKITLCANEGTILNLVGSEMTTGIVRKWLYATDPNSPFSVVPNSGAAFSLNTGNLTENIFYKVTLTCINTGDSVSTAPQGIVVNQLPSIVVYPFQSAICNTTTPVSLIAFGADTYEWSPAIGLSDTVGSNVLAIPPYSVAYTVKGTDFEGCVGTGIANVSVNTPNIWAKAYPVVVCPGGTSKFSVRDSLFELSIPPNNYASSAALASADEDIINVTLSGYLNNSSVCGVAATGAGSVAARYSNYKHLTPPTILAGTTINGTITLKSCGNFPYQTGFAIFIDYNRNGVFDLPDERVAAGAPIASALGNGTVRPFSFTIPVATFGGVTMMRVVAVENADGTTGQISPDGTYLWGETEDYLIRISRIIPSSSYVWSPATIPSVGAIVMTSSMTVNTTYTVTATDIQGCIDTANIQLDISNKMILAPSAPDLVCENTPFTIEANAIGGTPITYNWSSNAGNTGIVSLSLPVGTYTYTVSANNSCSLVEVDSVTFTVKPKPDITLSPDAAMICSPANVSVEVAASGAFNYSWHWPFNDDIITGDSVTLAPPMSVTYNITGQNNWGCIDTANIYIIVGQQVLTNVENEEISLCPTDSTMLSASATIAPYSTYCPFFHANGCFGDNISQVQLNTLNHASGPGCGDDNQYSYFNGGGTQTTELIAGNTYNLTVSFGYDPYQYFAAWIDYNQDNGFHYSDYLGASTANAGSNGSKSITFTVPLTAINGTTRLRIIGGSNSPIPIVNGCDSSASLFGETEDYDITILGGQAPNLQYVWSPATFLNTTNGNSVQAQNITTPITYTLTTTSLQGCQTIDTINVAFYPNIGNPAGQDINIQPLNCGTQIALNASGIGTWSGGNGSFSAINDANAMYSPALGEYNSSINLVWTMPNFCPHTDTLTVNIAAPDSAVAMNIAPSNDSVYVADYELNIGDWTHYYDNHNSPSNECDDYLLLSIKNGNTNGNSIGHIGDAGFDMTLHAQSGHSALTYPTTPYMVYGALWYPMNRHWKMNVLQQPTTDVHLKYYVKDTDVSALQPIVASSTINNLKIYTINNNLNYNLDPQNQHVGIPTATPYNYQGNGYWEYSAGTNPTVINWALSNIGTDYAAEIVASKITGGGAGMGGAFFSLPADVLYFDGYNRREGNVLQWRTENEQNSKEFRLMRSEDNVTYTHLVTIPTKTNNGTSNVPLDYISLDSNPYQVTYYQLIHVDIDGKETQSSVIMLRKINDTVFFHSLYPNPTHTDINFVLFLNQVADCKIEIIDMAGKIIDTMLAENLSRGFNTLNIDIRKLAKGAYTAKIINLGDGSNYHAKFFKL